MIQFNVAGQYLELPTDLDLQFTKSNVLFAFDDIECERTTSFEIPSTPINDKIFGVAKNYHYYGQAMRQKFAAQMQAGLVVQDGLLYIDNYDYEKGVYNVIFVTGGLLALKLIADEGKIADYYHPTTGCNWNGEYIAQQPNLWKTWIYAQGSDIALDAAHSKPSINLFLMAQEIATQFGLQLTSTNNMAKNLQYVPETLYKSDGAEAAFGDIVYMRYSLPDMTFGELLKMIAYASGCVIDISGNTITIERGDVSGWYRVDIASKVISVNKCKRIFGDFARWNKITGIWTSRFKSGIDSRTLAGYLVDNDNIEAENELYELPVPIPYETVRVVDTYMAWLSGEGTNWIALKPYDNTHQLIVLQDEGVYQVGVPTNDMITDLCNQSTTIEITALMTLLEYESITPKTKLLYDGCEWVWTNIDYSNGQATLTLSKV